MSYWDAKRDGVKMGELNGEPMFFYKEEFHVRVDGVELKAKSVSSLRSQVSRLSAEPKKVIRFNISLYGYGVEVLKAIAYSKKLVFEVDEDGKKHRISSDRLYVHKPELEKKMRELCERAKQLDKDIDEALKEAERFG